LIAAADGAVGDVTQAAGAGYIDAGAGSLFVRGANIDLQNPVTADSMWFETLRDGGEMTFADLNIGSQGMFTGGFIDIARITHTGGPALLSLGFVDHSRPVEVLTIGSLASAHGVIF